MAIYSTRDGIKQYRGPRVCAQQLASLNESSAITNTLVTIVQESLASQRQCSFLKTLRIRLQLLRSICQETTILSTPHRGLVPITFRMYPSKISETLVNRDVSRVGQEDSKVGQWEKATWPHLQELAQNCPEAGIHFQGIS